MLLSAYLRDLTLQSSAGSKLLPQQQKSFREVPFHSRNTLPQPSFRNSILNTIHCKPQLAIYFILPSAFIWFQCPVAWFSVSVTYPLLVSEQSMKALPLPAIEEQHPFNQCIQRLWSTYYLGKHEPWVVWIQSAFSRHLRMSNFP